MIQFYAPDIAETLTLPESDSQHCCRVLRMNTGDTITVIDGKGHRYSCEIVAAHQKHTAVKIVGCEEIGRTWGNRITIGVAPTKHLDRMEWMTEKLTEIGVDRIVPLRCDRSERKEIKTERLSKIAISAMKQSLKTFLPEVEEMTPIKEVLRGYKEHNRYIAYCDTEVERTPLSSVYSPQRDTIILIGPEGDFSPAEVKLALDEGWIPVTLGESRLRTETAAIVACHTCQLINDKQ